MSLSADFNSSHAAKRLNDSVLQLEYNYMKYFYDFDLRIMTTLLGYGQSGSVSVTPFSQLDRETLVNMREKLIELKGKPPELPAETPSNPGNTRQLRP